MSFALRSPRNVLALFAVVRQRQTYLNLLYLLTAFPLGLVYYVFLITGLSTSIGLLIVWVGVPLLFVMALSWWWIGAFERELAMWWLNIDIPPMGRPATGKTISWPRLREYLSNPITWKSLLYVLAKFPLGIFSFLVATVLTTVSVSLCCAPLVLIFAHSQGLPYDALNLLGVVALCLSGVIMGIFALHLLNALAWISGQFARFMLGMSASEMRIAQARAVAAQAQARAARADQSRRELIVNVSHELRTPIASIRGHVDSLLIAAEHGDANASSPADQRAYLEIVAREAERLGMLVDDLLALARAEADELKLVLAPVDAASVVAEVAAALAPLAKRERQVTLIHEVAADLPPVWADRPRLVQVLLNLVRNAITYTPAGGIVSITVQRADAYYLAIQVADTGIGIPPEDLPHVFERFYRTDASRARASGGFGLGLAIVRDLVSAMGGTVAVTSQVDQGSRFIVTLRVAPPPAPPYAAL